jgi:hypothetical protein
MEENPDPGEEPCRYLWATFAPTALWKFHQQEPLMQMCAPV